MRHPTPRSPVRSRSRRAPVALLGVLASAAALLTACGTTGRDLRTPVPNAVAPTRSSTPLVITTTTLPVGTVVPSGFTLTSPAFTNGGTLPAPFTCDGPSPELRWSGVPDGTAQLVLAVVDRDASSAVQWLVSDIPPTDGSVLSGTPPTGGHTLVNSFQRDGWTAPCPTNGSTHRYDFVVLALPAPITVSSSDAAAGTYTRMREAAGGREAVLMATVTH